MINWSTIGAVTGILSALFAGASLLLLILAEVRRSRELGPGAWHARPIGAMNVPNPAAPRVIDVIELSRFATVGATIISITCVGFRFVETADHRIPRTWTPNESHSVGVQITSGAPWALISWSPHSNADLYVATWIPLNGRDFEDSDILSPRWYERWIPLRFSRLKPVGPKAAAQLATHHKRIKGQALETIVEKAIQSGDMTTWPPGSQWRTTASNQGDKE